MRWRVLLPKFALLGTMGIASMSASCTDPVLDDAIEALGDEPGFYWNESGQRTGTEEGPLHRPGQPCVTCHQKSGSVSGAPFVVAGTIFEAKEGERRGANGVQVLLVDAGGKAPRENPRTNEAGNFFVRPEDWPDFEGFPMRVAVYRPDVLTQHMNTHIGREPSCAGCHRDVDRRIRNDELTALGRVYLRVQ